MFLLRVFALVSFGLLTACGPRPSTNGGSGRQIVLTDSLFEAGSSDTLRFGRMRSGEVAVRQLRLVNRTARPMVIVSADRSCGCVSLQYDERPIAPGETQTVALSFDSRGEHGWQLKRIDLRFAGRKHPVRFFVEAEVR